LAVSFRFSIFNQKKPIMKKVIFAFIAVALPVMVYAQNIDILCPAAMDRETIIHHTSFSLSYNSSYVLPSWVAYKVTKSQVNVNEKIKAKYKADPAVTTRSGDKKDYKDGGYLMAQLVNNFDVQLFQNGQEETHYMSNIVPMKLAFYNHVWIRTEELIRLWNANTDGIYVVCGPILTDTPFTTIGENKISIPKRYYKAIYDPKNQKAIGFIFRNGSVPGTLKSCAVSIDEIEKESGIDLFPTLDDELENKIESGFNVVDWDFKLIE
jgi:endonuclease G